MAMGILASTLMVVSCSVASHGHPRIGSTENGFLPSENFLDSKDQLAMESFGNGTITPSASDKAGRFGFATFPTDGQNVNNIVPGLYGPVKLDIGGLVLGTIVGLGAFFILPKIFHVITAPYGSYKRSEDDVTAGGLSVSEIYERVSKGLEAMNLDEAACVQRVICSSVNTSPVAQQLLAAISTNEVVKSMVDGTGWDRAVNVGKTGQSCGQAFPKCPFTVESMIKPMLKYISST